MGIRFLKISLLPLLLLIAATGCEEPAGGSSALKKPAQFGIKPDSIPLQPDVPTTDDNERNDNVIILLELEANTRFVDGYAKINKPGKLQAVVPLDFGAVPSGILKARLEVQGFQETYSWVYDLKIGKPGLATQLEHNTMDRWGDYYISMAVDSPTGKPYTIQLQYVTYD